MRTKFILAGLTVGSLTAIALAQQPKGPSASADSKAPPSSYMPVVETESFSAVMKRMKDNKKKVEDEHAKLLSDRYDLGDHPASGVTMSRGKPVQEGVRVKLASGVTWDALAAMAPEEIKRKDLLPQGLPAAAASQSSRRAACCFPSSRSTRSRSRKTAT